MSAPIRYDDQYCPIARALDVLGDRWTLLVLRELLAGDRRFTDLRSNLPGVTPAVLTDRLRSLTERGLIESVPAPHGSRSRYSITRRGRDAVPVMRALARFGMPLLEDPAEAEYVRPWSAVQTCVLAYYDAAAASAEGIDERYLFRIDGEDHLVSTVRGGGPDREPDLVIETTAATLFAIRQRRVSFDDVRSDGTMLISGPPACVRHLRAAFRLGG